MQKKNYFFTIVTPDYIDQAIVWYESMIDSIMLSSSYDNSKYLFEIYLLGCVEKVNVKNTHAIKYVEDCVDSSIIDEITKKYTPAESCWVLKSFLLEYLINQKFEYVFYFDSDIYLFGNLYELPKQMNNASILLTPHYLIQYPTDNFTPTELTLLRAGLFNAGFIGVRNTGEARRFLHWWQAKNLAFGYNEPNNGMCGDQRWLDLVPILFNNVKICQHKGFNVAYWNLHERNISILDGKYYCGNDPLIFFHFSGFLSFPRGQIKLSRYSNRDLEKFFPVSLLIDYKEKITKKRDEFVFFSKKYKYTKWWHKNYKIYRRISKFLDL